MKYEGTLLLTGFRTILLDNMHVPASIEIKGKSNLDTDSKLF